MTHFRDTQGVDGHSSIDAAPAGALEVSTWSTRSAASMNEVDADERRPIMACRGRSWRPHRERPSWSLKSVYNRAHSLRTPQQDPQKAEENPKWTPFESFQPEFIGRSLDRGQEFADELLDAGLDVVADDADGVDALAGRVVELPVLVALAREVGASVAASHGDHDVGFLDGLGGEDLWPVSY